MNPPFLKQAKVDLTFRGSVSDLEKVFPKDAKDPKGDADRPPIFDQRSPNQIVDAMEEELGIRKRVPRYTFVTKNKIFRPTLESDRDLLNKLMNETDKYNVVRWSENWDRNGEMKIFVIYQEITEAK